MPRHAFVPEEAWASTSGSASGQWIDRRADPHGWWQAVYSDTAIYTQLDDGATPLTAENAARTFAPTSSASSPLLVLAFLRRLAARPGDRVLDVGTGTGWTAGLLCHLTGEADLVTSVEIDATLSRTARTNLASLGLAPHLVVADGAAGVPGAAPFDRVHVTCGVRDIPHAWVEQTRPGGVIVLPHARTMRLLRLTVAGDGTADGSFHEQCSFMLLRSQRPPVGRLAETPARLRDLATDPAPLLAPDPGLGVLLFDALGAVPFLAEGRGLLFSGASRATVEDGRVTQTGPRDLWDEAEAVLARWLARGRPGLERLEFRVTPERQYLWLDEPDSPASEPATAGDT
ncbi:hypothetical protein ACTWP5_23765 [Streptomyces sp. 4N509B]|uniref:hypothetical protein n=1 Tax=Streptomyces sp. 4N509B TaxID=3457413 RepID=UPI003FD1506F